MAPQVSEYRDDLLKDRLPLQRNELFWLISCVFLRPLDTWKSVFRGREWPWRP